METLKLSADMQALLTDLGNCNRCLSIYGLDPEEAELAVWGVARPMLDALGLPPRLPQPVPLVPARTGEHLPHPGRQVPRLRHRTAHHQVGRVQPQAEPARSPHRLLRRVAARRRGVQHQEHQGGLVDTKRTGRMQGSGY